MTLKTRATSLALFLSGILLAGSAMAQIHGVPASATSLGPGGFTGRNFSPGIPAGATSLGPNGFTGNRPRFDGEIFLTNDARRNHSGRLRAQPFFIPLMYSPFYYEMTALPEPPAQYYPPQSQQSAAMPAKFEL